MFVRVRLPIGTPHSAVLIPEAALGRDQGQRFVYVVDDKDVAEYRRVEVGLLDEGLRVIEKGLKPSERIVISGLQLVQDKRPVQVLPPEPPKAKPEPKTASPLASAEQKSADAK